LGRVLRVITEINKLPLHFFLSWSNWPVYEVHSLSFPREGRKRSTPSTPFLKCRWDGKRKE
jgi:hypothetical protein